MLPSITLDTCRPACFVSPVPPRCMFRSYPPAAGGRGGPSSFVRMLKVRSAQTTSDPAAVHAKALSPMWGGIGNNKMNRCRWRRRGMSLGVVLSLGGGIDGSNSGSNSTRNTESSDTAPYVTDDEPLLRREAPAVSDESSPSVVVTPLAPPKPPRRSKAGEQATPVVTDDVARRKRGRPKGSLSSPGSGARESQPGEKNSPTPVTNSVMLTRQAFDQTSAVPDRGAAAAVYRRSRRRRDQQRRHPPGRYKDNLSDPGPSNSTDQEEQLSSEKDHDDCGDDPQSPDDLIAEAGSPIGDGGSRRDPEDDHTNTLVEARRGTEVHGVGEDPGRGRLVQGQRRQEGDERGDDDEEEEEGLSLLEPTEVDAILRDSVPLFSTASPHGNVAGTNGDGFGLGDVDETTAGIVAAAATEEALMAMMMRDAGEDVEYYSGGVDDINIDDELDDLQALEEEWLAFADASAADIERSTSTRSSTTSISRRHNVDRGDLVEQLPVGEGGKVGDDEEKLEESEWTETEKRPWRHALSLQARLGMTGDDVETLRSSGRSGLNNPTNLIDRMTGNGAGGPTTAVGYLLGELRMKPEQVKDALMRWPSLLRMSEMGPHAVSAWLQGGLGLSVDDVCKMIKRHPAIVASSIVHNLRPKLGWLQLEVGLSRPKSIRLVVRCPAIFACSIDDNLVPKVEWLETKLNFSRQEVARVIYANPGILLRNTENSLMPKITWLAEALEMEEDMIFDMIRRFPGFFTLSSEQNLEPKLEWLASQASSDIVRHVLYRQPSLLGHNAEGNLAPKVQWLQDRLGMTEEAAWKFIGRSPGFLTLSIVDTLEPKLWWLRDKLDVDLEGAARILNKFPTLFTLSIETSLEPKLWWVRDELGLDRPDAATILRRCPQIFGSSLKNTLEPKLSWLASRLKTNTERIAQIVRKYPQLLVYSVEGNLGPTMDFFESDMGPNTPKDLLEQLESKPSVLAASLDKRLRPRVFKIRAKGIEPNFIRDLRPVAQMTDKEFRAWLARLPAKVAKSDGRQHDVERIHGGEVAARVKKNGAGSKNNSGRDIATGEERSSDLVGGGSLGVKVSKTTFEHSGEGDAVKSRGNSGERAQAVGAAGHSSGSRVNRIEDSSMKMAPKEGSSKRAVAAATEGTSDDATAVNADHVHETNDGLPKQSDPASVEYGTAVTAVKPGVKERDAVVKKKRTTAAEKQKAEAMIASLDDIGTLGDATTLADAVVVKEEKEEPSIATKRAAYKQANLKKKERRKREDQ